MKLSTLYILVLSLSTIAFAGCSTGDTPGNRVAEILEIESRDCVVLEADELAGAIIDTSPAAVLMLKDCEAVETLVARWRLHRLKIGDAENAIERFRAIFGAKFGAAINTGVDVWGGKAGVHSLNITLMRRGSVIFVIVH